MKSLKISLILLFAFACSAASLWAQNYARYSNIEVSLIKDANGNPQRVRCKMDVVVPTQNFSSQEMLILTPQLYNDGQANVENLPLIVIAGNTRYKVLTRKLYYHGKIDNAEILHLYRYKAIRDQKFSYTYETPYKEWMKRGKLGVTVTKTACASCVEPYMGVPIQLDSIKRDAYQPVFTVAYVSPKVEPVKNRSEKLEARFTYEVGKSELLRDFGNNAQEFNNVDKFMQSLINEKNIKVSDYKVDGYASPDGSEKTNKELSLSRAETFASYLKTTYNIPDSKMRVRGHGEDWNTLKEKVEKSSLTNKAEIVSIINKYTGSKERKSALQKLDRGKTVKLLLDDFYPSLRRNTLNVSFVVKAFNIDEAMEVYKTKPSLLSEEEFFRVSKKFTKGSQDFIDVFVTAVKFYPNSEIANLNTGAAYIESRSYDAAEAYLMKARKAAEAINNLAIVYFYQGKYDLAKEYFQRAAQKGYAPASTNLAEVDAYFRSLK